MVGTDHGGSISNQSKNIFTAKDLKPDARKANYDSTANNLKSNNRPVKSSAILMKDEMNINIGENRKGRIVIGAISPPRLVLRNNLFSKNRDLYRDVGKQIAQNNKMLANNPVSESVLTSPTDRDIKKNTKLLTNKGRINKNYSKSNIIDDYKDPHFYQKFANFQSINEEELKKAAVEMNYELRSNQTLSRLEHDSVEISRNKGAPLRAIKSLDKEVRINPSK